MIWPVGIGLVLNVSGWHSPLLTRLLDTIGGSFLLLMMLMLGLRFQFDPACLKLSSLTIVLKTAIGVALGCLAAAMLD